MATTSQAITEARKYLGIAESPSGSNKQMFGAWYGNNGAPWCAMFLSYVAYHVGIRFKGATTEKGFASVPAIVTWAKKNKCFFTRGHGQPGDWVAFDWNGDGLADHVELVVAIKDGNVTSIGGNTGSAHGGAVLEHAHRESLVLGYMRPPYTK